MLENEELEVLVNQMELIAEAYFSKKRVLYINRKLNDSICAHQRKTKKQYMAKVESTYLRLRPIEQLFINNEFFYEDYPDWWKGSFSEEDYLILKKKAIIHFLRVFYEW